MINQTENDSLLRYGDESILWTFGSEEQNTLNLVSKVIASASTSEEAENTLISIAETASELESLGDSRPKGIMSWIRKDRIEESYKSILKRINGLTVSLRLRQAELAKDITMLDKAYTMLDECIKQLEQCVIQGRALTAGQENESIDDAWISRFSVRLESLELSKTIALQTAAQIRMMKTSKQDLMQKLQDLVANVIPLWRNQVSMFLGLQQINADNEYANQIGAVVSSHLKKTTEDSRAVVRQTVKKSQEDKKDMQILIKSSAELLEALREVKSMEEDYSEKSLSAKNTLNNEIILNVD